MAKVGSFYRRFSLFARIRTLSSWAHYKVGTFHYRLKQQFSAEICGFGCCWGVSNLNFGKNWHFCNSSKCSIFCHLWSSISPALKKISWIFKLLWVDGTIIYIILKFHNHCCNRKKVILFFPRVSLCWKNSRSLSQKESLGN